MTAKTIPFILILLATVPAFGATYYVDAQATDGGNGLSEGTAWNQLSDITGLVAGDSVLLQRGDVWREALTTSASGTSGSPITLGAYGTGANPLLKGSVLVTGWTGGGGGSWIETDPGGNVTVAAGQVSWTGLPMNVDAYVYKDYGTGYFAGDFAHQYQMRLTSLSADDTSVVFYMLANFVDSWNHHFTTGLETDDAIFVYVARTGGAYSLYLRLIQDGNLSGWSVAVSAATTYYVTITRDDDGGANATGRVTAEVHTGDYHPNGVHVGTGYLDCAVGEQNDFRYAYALGTTHIGTTPTSVGFTQSMDLGAGVVDFTAGGSNQWNASLATEPSQVFFNGTRGVKKASQGAVAAQYDWYWASGILYTYAASDPDTLYAAPGVEASTMPTSRLGSVLAVRGDYVTVEGIDVTHSYGRGLEIEGATGDAADNVTIDGCTVSYSKDGGIVAANGRANYLTIEDCTVHHNNTGQLDPLVGGNPDTGMEAVSLEDTDDFTIRRCAVRENYREGIDAKYGSSNGYIYHNLCYNNGDVTTWQGIIQIYLDGCTNTDVYQNFLYASNGDMQGIMLGMENDSYPTSGIRIYSNVIHDCSQGVRFWAGSAISAAKFSNISIVNNTLYSCGEYGLIVTSAATDHLQSAWTIRNNIFWQDSGSAIVDETTGDQALALATVTNNGFATGQASDTMGTSYRQLTFPGFTNAGSFDYSLTSSSGFIDYGYNAGSPFDNGLADGAAWTANVLTRDQDPTFEIGAYAYQPTGSGLLLYTESDDVDGTMTVTETRVTGACDNDHGTRLWKDFGAGYFADAFTIRWVWMGNPGGTWTAGQRGYTGLSDELGPMNVVTGSGTSHSVWADYYKGSTSYITLNLRVYDGTVQEDSDSTVILTTGVLYYMQLKRTGGTAWEMKIWTGGYDQTLVATLNVTGLTGPAYRYMVPWSARSDGAAGNQSNWYLENLELGGGGGGTIVPVLSGQYRRRR